MTKFALTAVCAIALVLAVPAQAAAPPPLAELTRIASRVSGLKAKRKVKVVLTTNAGVERRVLAILDRDYPRHRQSYDETLYRALGLLNDDEQLRPSIVSATRGVRGVYDPVSTTLWASRTSSVRQTLLYNLVHALEDQTFGLKHVSSLRRGSRDAASAAAAAVEGSATLFSSLVDRKLQTRVPANPRSKLFLELIREFPATTGLRFAASLQNIGGRPAVHSALRRMPETTEQIFHLDAYLARERALPLELPTAVDTFQLVHDDTFGELDVRALLAVFQVPRLDRVGTGWGAGLSALYRSAAGNNAVVLRLDWDTDRDAQEWAEAMTVFVNEAYHADEPGFPPLAECAADACWSIGKRTIGFARNRNRTAFVVAASVPEAELVARTLVGAA
jgi:hypothetical protein